MCWKMMPWCSQDLQMLWMDSEWAAWGPAMTFVMVIAVVVLVLVLVRRSSKKHQELLDMIARMRMAHPGGDFTTRAGNTQGLDMSTTAFHQAVSTGSTEQVQRLITNGADVNAKDEDGQTPLHLAALHNDTEAAQLLISNGADVKAKDEDGNTPLAFAALKGHTEAAQLLITNGADVNAKDEDGWTALHLAVLKGHTEAAQVLTDNGADVNAKDNGGQTPLRWAALDGHTEIAQILITNGADLIPLRYGSGHEAMSQILSQQYPRPTPQGANGAGSNQMQMTHSEEHQLTLATIAQMQRDDPSIEQPP